MTMQISYTVTNSGKCRTINDSEGFPWSKLTGARRQPKPSFLVSIYRLIDEEKFIAIEYGTSKGKT